MINPKVSFPVFVVKNLSLAKNFYIKNFSFSVVFENEWYLHLISESGIQIGFMLPNQPSQPVAFHKAYDGSGVIFSIEVEDADDAYLEAKNHNLNIILDICSEDWGQRHFSMQDPNGIYLDIVQPIEPSAEYQ